MLKARKAICAAYREGKKCNVQSSEAVASFFEEIGLYVTKKVFEPDIVWDLYSSYIEHYWPMLKSRIEELRRDDPTPYTHFEVLHTKMHKQSVNRRAPSTTPTHEQLLEFTAEELDKTPPL
jgi:hypothetical protein